VTEKHKAHEFIANNSKLNEAGDARSVTQSNFLAFGQEVHMLTPDTIKEVSTFKKDIITGAQMVATDDLERLIKAAKKSGDDPKECTASVRISTPEGPITVETRGERTTTNPSTGEKIVHHGVTSVKVRAKTMIDPDAAKATEARISKLLG